MPRKSSGIPRRIFSSISSAASNTTKHISDKYRAYQESQQAAKQERARQKELELEEQRHLDEEARPLAEAMRYGIKKHKRHGRVGKLARITVAGALAAGAAFGTYEATGAREAVQNTARIAVYVGQAPERLGKAASHLVQTVSGGDKKRIAEAQSEFKKADEAYFTSLRSTLDEYRTNIENREDAIKQMTRLADGFGRVAQKAPGYQTLQETGVTGLRNKINALFARPFQSQEEIENRLSPEFNKNYNELLKMAEEADQKKSLNREEINALAKKMKETAKTMGKVNEADKARLKTLVEDTNRLYEFTRGMERLSTGEIRAKTPEYQNLVQLGNKYGLNDDEADKLSRMLAYGVGVAIAAAGAYAGGKVGRLIPQSRLDVDQTARDFVKQKRRREPQPQKGGLEDKVETAILLLAGIAILFATSRISAFAIADGNPQPLPTGVLTILLACILAAFLFVTFRHFYKIEAH